MKMNSMVAAAAFGVGVVLWSSAGHVPRSDAAEKKSSPNPQLAQLDIQLRGVSQ